MRFLLRIGIFDEHRAQHIHAKRHDARATRQRTFSVENKPLHGAPSGAAMGLRPVVGQPAAGVEDGVPFFLVGFAQALAGFHLVGNAGGQMVPQEGPHIVAEGLLLGGELEIHIDASASLLRKFQTVRRHPCHRQCTWLPRPI